MFSLYVSQQGCYVCLVGETLAVKRKDEVVARVPLPLVEQILILGKSQVTTQVIRSCLWRDIPIAYLSRMGFCYGRLLPVARGYRYLSRYQQGLSEGDRLLVARKIVEGKLRNRRSRRPPGNPVREPALRSPPTPLDKGGAISKSPLIRGEPFQSPPF